MLKQRIITAIVLLALLLPTLFYSDPRLFCAVALVFIAAGAWEWGRLNGYAQTGSWAGAGLCLLLCSWAWLDGLPRDRLMVLWLVAGVGWLVGGAWLMFRGVPAWGGIPRSVRWLLGVVGLCLAWLAMAQARVIGVNFLLSVFALVWAADIFAYGAGRTWGSRFIRSKLAPSISPGKSWEGAIGGLVGVFAMAAVWVSADRHWTPNVPSFYSELVQRGWGLFAAAVCLLTTMSVVGDLVESLIKRSAGVKDSSGLLPGHGGVLDRIDALLPTLPLAMMIYSLVKS